VFETIELPMSLVNPSEPDQLVINDNRNQTFI